MLADQPTQILAICLLVALSVGILASFFLIARRSPYNFGLTVLYCINQACTRLLWRTEISGKLPITPTQGAVIVSNHISGVDPLFIQLATERVVHWMVAREYTTAPVMGWAFRTLKIIPVGRGGVDTAATKMAIRYAQNGGLVGLFPEGRINTTDELLLPGRPGVALIALKAARAGDSLLRFRSTYGGSPLSSFFMAAHVRVKIGPAIDISDFYDRGKQDGVLEELTKRFMKAIAALAGHPDFEPQLAGRRWKNGDKEEQVENGRNSTATSDELPQ